MKEIEDLISSLSSNIKKSYDSSVKDVEYHL